MRRIDAIMGAAAMAMTAALAGSAPAQAAQAQAVKVDGRAVVAEVRRLLAENYVVKETRPVIDAALARGLASGRYDVADPAVLEERINADLEAAAHDKHLGIHYDPKQVALIGQRQGDEEVRGPVWERMAQLSNHGLTEMKVLPGNVRYLAVDGFGWAGPKSATAYDVAMRFLAEGDAAIIDIRRNGGGSPAAVQYLVSHFMEADKPLVTFYMGGAPEVDKVSTLAELPAGRMIGKPLYVLTSNRSASAAEEFAGHVSGFNLGELIGETTAGAAYRNDFFPVLGQYALSVSVGRPELAATGGDWEGKGVAPTTRAELSKTLDIAHMHAVRRLAQTASAQEKPQLESIAAMLAAKVEPVKTARPLAAYAGTYGERTISLEDGRLVFQRAGGPKSPLIAIGANLFAFETDPMTRVEFASAGEAAASLELLRGDGSKVQAARTK